MKSIYFVLDKNILPETTTTIEWKSAIISRARPQYIGLCSHPQHFVSITWSASINSKL